MADGIEKVLQLVESFSLDDCATLSNIFSKYGFLDIVALSNVLQQNTNGHEGIYFKDAKLKFYALKDAKEFIDFMAKNYEHRDKDKLIARLNKKGDPRNWIETANEEYDSVKQ